MILVIDVIQNVRPVLTIKAVILAMIDNLTLLHFACKNIPKEDQVVDLIMENQMVVLMEDLIIILMKDLIVDLMEVLIMDLIVGLIVGLIMGLIVGLIVDLIVDLIVMVQIMEDLIMDLIIMMVLITGGLTGQVMVNLTMVVLVITEDQMIMEMMILQM